MKYSIIIPTMWFHVNQLLEMLDIYNSMDIVGEILIVNNDGTKTPELNFDKVRLIGSGKNIYVNKAWELGVKESKYNSVILANDDITIKGNLSLVLEKISYLLREGVLFGVGVKCYSEYLSPIKLLKRLTTGKTIMSYGFGVFMLMKKSTFLNTPIPKDIKVWYGDHVLYYTNEAWVFEGVNIITGMRGTTSRINLSGFAAKEKQAFNRYIRANQ